MQLTSIRTILFSVAIAAFAIQASAQDLRAYYEQQKTEFAPLFNAPELGAKVTITLTNGQVRKGILMKLGTDSVSITTDAGTNASYKRDALQEKSKVLFFAADFAHITPIEKTTEYKKQLRLKNATKEQANTHGGRMLVTAKTEKKSDKKEVEKEKENKNTGDTITTTTTTRTYTEVQNLKVTISNTTPHPDSYTLAWYVYAEPIDNGDRSLHDSGTKKISLAGRKRVQESISTKAIVRKKVSTGTSSSNKSPTVRESGNENAGWLVVLKYENDILDSKASSKKFLTEEWLKAL